MSKKQEMPKDKDILQQFEQLKDNKQFKMPEGYFDSFADNIMEKIEAEQKPKRQASVVTLLKPYIAVAASFAALFLLAYTTISIVFSDKEQERLSENEIMAELQADIENIDELALFELLESENVESINNDINLTEDEIINYLMEHDPDIDLLNSDF